MSDSDGSSPWSPEYEAGGGSFSFPNGRSSLDDRSEEQHDAAKRTDGSSASRRRRTGWPLVAIAAVSAIGGAAIATQLITTSNDAVPANPAAGVAETSPPNTVLTTLVEPAGPLDDTVTVPIISAQKEDGLRILGVTSLGTFGRPSATTEETEADNEIASVLGGDRDPIVASLDDRTVVVTATGNAYEISRDTDPVDLGLGIGGPVFGELNSDVVWFVQPAGPGIEILQLQFSETGLIPTAGGITEYRDATVLGNDGNGNVVIRNPGGVYVVGDAPPVRLTTGTLLAIGPDTAFVRECDENLECTNVVIDRTNGDRIEFLLDFDFVPIEPRIGLGALPTISVGGRQAIVRVSNKIGQDETQWRLFDFERNSSTVVAPPDPSSPILWGDTGSTAAWLSDSILKFWTYSTDPDSNQAVSVEGIPKLSAITSTED